MQTAIKNKIKEKEFIATAGVEAGQGLGEGCRHGQESNEGRELQVYSGKKKMHSLPGQ